MQLAAAYRIFVQLGWQALIYKHISLRVPNEPGHLLLNPFGLHYSEVCASNLLKVDVRGNTVGHSVWPINPAGFTFHGLMWLLQRACEVQVAMGRSRWAGCGPAPPRCSKAACAIR